MDSLDQFILQGGSPEPNPFGNHTSLNFTGTLMRDPILGFLPNSTVVCEFGLDLEGWECPPSLQRLGIPQPEFVLCKAYDQTAKIIDKYHHKGSQISISGRLWNIEKEQMNLIPKGTYGFEKLIVLINEIELHRPAQIQQICYKRDINILCHFTKIGRLSSILHRGLLNRNLLETLPSSIRPPFTDQNRDDGYKEAMCLSISFPNYKMFFSNTGHTDQHEWVVLLLEARALWELDCAFCHQNAIYKPVLDIPLEDKKKLEALKRMFWDWDYINLEKSRSTYERDSQIPDAYPTHPEAEVLVFDSIPAGYINGVHFYDDTALQTWRKDNQGTYSQKFYSNKQYFGPRCDYKAWQN